jgi:hypothetical protein
MPWNNNSGYNFDTGSIASFAPAMSGVYAIYRPNFWIYIGESNDIRRRLTEHLNESGTCIKRQMPTGFSYELWPEGQRVTRQNQLIAELNPSCNQMMG